ncbi:hypothetical protein MTR67_025887 [Solanum verrucosum]|uniref:Integrase zinc-binding domain-containing protein n=1 Tax=Solanum verrucosum TaxID=315347 RepID=A0AAF0QXY4_SOLVR|nr:hypothetical protein MTR67_025887 [Solanum verrucosum]
MGQPSTVSTSTVGAQIASEVNLTTTDQQCSKRFQKMKPPQYQGGKSEDAYEFLTLCHEMLETVGRPEAETSNVVITDIVPVFHRPASVLFDPGSLSFLAFIQDTSVEPPSINSVPVVRELVDLFPTDLPVSKEGIRMDPAKIKTRVRWCPDVEKKGRICVPKTEELTRLILEDANCSQYFIHSGVAKMYRDLSQHYWWCGMKKDIADVVSRCLTCPQVKYEHHRPGGLSQRMPTPT